MLLDYVQVLKALDYSELADIQAISICNSEYHKILKQKYEGFFHQEETPIARSLPRNIMGQEVDVTKASGQNAMIMFFRAGRR